MREARCDGCAARRPLEGSFPAGEIEHACGGRFRPDIVWFGEALPRAVWDLAVAAAARADVVLVVGTSGIVNPAALLATQVPRNDATVIEVNPEETVVSARARIVLRGTASEMLPALIETAA